MDPGRDATPWIKLNLMAHHIQAQTVLRRIDEASRMWVRIDELLASRRLPERAGFAIYDALLGLRVRRAGYARETGLEPSTAARDLRAMVAAKLLEPVGATRGRVYVAANDLRAVRNEIAAGRVRPVNPYRS